MSSIHRYEWQDGTGQGPVLHRQSRATTLLSLQGLSTRKTVRLLKIQSLERLKGLPKITGHDSLKSIQILANTQEIKHYCL